MSPPLQWVDLALNDYAFDASFSLVIYDSSDLPANPEGILANQTTCPRSCGKNVSSVILLLNTGKVKLKDRIARRGWETIRNSLKTSLTSGVFSRIILARDDGRETMTLVLPDCSPFLMRSREACATDAHQRRFLNMRVKLVTFGITAVAALALVVQASSQAIAQGNSNKPAAAKKKTPPPPPPKPAAAKPAPAATPEQTTMAAKPKPKPKPKKKAAAMAGVPKGVPACIKHLTDMAAKDPLIAYDGHPSEIINGGLLWNDPKSRCSVGGDEAMRKKVVELAGAWRRKDASQVRSLLQELAAK